LCNCRKVSIFTRKPRLEQIEERASWWQLAAMAG
jgi:hypothetical protein